MRIGIDARFYGPVAGTGIGRYTQRLLEQLELIDPDNQYVVFLRAENFGLYQPSSPRFRKVLAPWRWYSLAEQVHFPRLLRRERLDLTHFTHFNVPLFSPRPFVVTVHDLILHKFPTQRASTLEPAFYWLKQGVYRFVIRQAVHRARSVIAVSRNTQRDILGTFKIPEARTVVTHESWDGLAETASVDELIGRYDIRPPFALYFGNAYPHKNLERCIQAFEILWRRGQQVQLVLVGREDYFYRRLKKFVDGRGANRDQKKIVFTGFLKDDQLGALLRQARLYVFPSFYEGFGIPGLEAMAKGVPVVAARASCLPEIYGQAAEYFNPDRPEDMAAVIGSVLRDPAKQAALRQRGRQQIKQYSWRRMAEQTLAVYTGSRSSLVQ